MTNLPEKLAHLKIPFEDIQSATDNFADANLIRKGGFGRIYRGKLTRSGKTVDIVARRFDSMVGGQTYKEFWMEILMLYSLKHQNLVSVVGFFEENDEKIIVNKHEANGSLDKYLSDPTFTWTQRLQVCLDVARALSYIQYDEQRNFSVIHRNLKSSKILLDEKWEAKVSGFELSMTNPVARRYDLVLDHEISGTYAYVDPAYVKSGGVTHKSDVYALGVILFEVMSGKKSFIPYKDEGDSPRLAEPLSMVGKLQEVVNDEGHAPTMTKRHSHESILDDVKRDGHSTQLLPSPSNEGILDENVTSEGSSTQLAKQLSNEGELQKLVNDEAHAPPLAKPHSNEGKPPSFNDIQQLMVAPSFSAIYEPHNISLTEEEYCDNDSYAAVLYMTTFRNLEHLQVPKEGLLSQLAKSHYEAGNLDDIIHPGLRVQMDSQSLKLFSEAAYCCLKELRTQRPNIDQIIVALEKALEHQLKRENSERSIVEAQGTSTSYLEGKDLEHLKIELDAIVLATENFAEKYYIGAGGYGIVYKAELEHFDSSATKGKKDSKMPKIRSTVAIKSIIKREDTQGEEGFLLEIKTLSSCNHPNVISLLGFCYEHPRMFLVYEHASNGSLDDYLGGEGKMTNLTWVQRIKICIDTARGLDYIHSSFLDKEKIIHRDVKSANILLNENWEAKIADFGLSKVNATNQTGSTLNDVTPVGTAVYIDPEYRRDRKLKKESDIYSFGVVMFEILFGRLAYDELFTKENEKGLAPIARKHFEKGTLKKMVDLKLWDESDENIFTLSKGPNKESLDTFSRIAYKCLAETQAERPTIKVVIKELEKALDFQETHKNTLRMSFEDVKLATRNFHPDNIIGEGGFGMVYRGQVVHGNAHTTIALKRLNPRYGQGEKEFLKELGILFEYKHENIIGLVGYCDEKTEKLIVYEYASNISLDTHLKDASLTWTKRLKIAIDVAAGLDFLHGGVVTQDMVIHRDLKSANILLTADWKAKITDFGLSIITPMNTEIDFVVDSACGTPGYCDPLYLISGFLTKESDIYSLGVVLCEMMCGRLAYVPEYHDERSILVALARRHYEEGKLDEMVFKDIKDQIVPKSLATYQEIAYQCLRKKREDRPTASKVVEQLRKALEFQEDYEIWEPKLPRDYKEIIKMTNTPEIWSNKSNKEILDMLSKGILLQNDTVWFSLSANERRNEMISAKMFSYENHGLLKWKSIHKARFPKVAKMMDTSNLNIQIQIKTQFLSPGVNYGVHVVFKFCNPKTFSNKPTYVNLRYKMRSETLHTHFAIPRDDNWMMIELCRFLNHKEDADFEVLLESFSTYCRGSGAICVEGIEFKAIDTVENKQVQSDLESNLNMNDGEQYLPTDYEQIIKRSKQSVHNKSKNELASILFKGILIDEGEKFFSLSKVNGKKCDMLPAKAVLYDSANLKLYTMTQSDHSRFQVVIELLAHQVFRLKCKIERQLLSSNTNYACHLVFKLSEKCRGLLCPVKVRDLLHEKSKEIEILYVRSPGSLNLHDAIRVPEQRDDGWMEVKVWEFNSNYEFKKSHIPMDLKLISYEGTMSGLIVNGLDFRPV